MHRIIVRTLTRELRLHTNSEEAAVDLAYVGADPVMPGRDLQPIDLTVEATGPFFRVDLPGFKLIEGSIEEVVGGVFRLLAAWLLDDTRGLPLMHAGLAVIEGRRFVFLGDKGFGKTTLILSLIERGITVEGDEHIVLTADSAITRPRRLHVKETSVDLVPALRDAILASPSMAEWTGNRVFACPPSMHGASWEIAEAPIDHVVFVTPNFGGSSILSPLSRDEAFARLMETAFLPSEGRGKAVARLRKLCIDAKNWNLQSGNLDQALKHLRAVAN
ncbi:hypothetical protein [Oricola sp.]|uniref:hypothetical protein n=1 Tax=Oricola sp. TaxID=1979950 RepID=UPI0025E490F7|nr:hypothetical protein [Oricola sp.]MCI5073612.1 hypothetical protein [Oricola sp.]